MAKLLDMNGAQMASALVGIAAPLKRLMEDEEFSTVFKKATKKGLDMGWNDVLTIYVDVVPHLLGDKHIKDTFTILSIIEDKKVSELMKMDGTELIADFIKAFNEQLKPFFMRLGLSVGGKQ